MKKILTENVEPNVVTCAWAIGGLILGYTGERSILNSTVSAALIGCVIGFCIKWYKQGKTGKS